MAAQQLNVRVGLVFDEKSLASIERSMKSAGQRLSRLGTDLTLSLSAPLAALGVTAIKSAGDIESLTLALKSQLGTADAAGKELDKLTEAAKNPGLGVEQAVRGSVRLQGVGLAAEEARNILIQMGNAIASTGGSAQELDNVTRQFAQIISKGRLLQEDVTVLSENFPGLAQLMQKTFGTTSVEAIRNMGVSGKEFVLQITKAAESLPRVESGIKNGIGNAIDSLKQSAAKVGFAINEAFDVTGAIENVSGAVLTVAMAFSSLDPALQKTILGFAGVAIAIGPVIKGYGALQLLGSQLVGGWASIVSAGKSLVAFLGTATTAFNALSLASRAFILVGLVAAVLQIAESFGAFTREATAAEKVQASINKLSAEAETSISQEKGAVDRLIGVLNNETSSREAKAAALKELKAISPEYFGQLAIENGAVTNLTAAYSAYISNLLLAAKAKKAEGRLIEIDEAKTKELQDQKALQEQLAKNTTPKRREGFGANDQGILSTSASELGAIAAQITASQARVAQLDLESQALLKLSQAGFEAQAKEKAAAEARAKEAEIEAKAVAAAAEAKKEAIEVSEKMAKALKEVYSDVSNAAEAAKLLGDDVDLAKIKALEDGIKKLLDEGFKPASAEVLNLKRQLDSLNEKPTDVVINIIKREGGGGIADLAGGAKKIDQALPNIKPVELPPIAGGLDLEEQKSLANSWRDTYIGAANEIASATFSILGASSAKHFEEERTRAEEQAAAALAANEGNAEAQAQIRAGLSAKLAQIEKKEGRRKKAIALSEAIANTAVAVTKAIGSAPPPFNIPAIVAASVAGAAQVAVIAAQPFARGTNDAPGGLALVGEQGPELINLPRHSQVFPTPQTNQMLSNMGGEMVLSGELRASAGDLVALVEMTQAKNKRFR